MPTAYEAGSGVFVHGEAKRALQPVIVIGRV